MFCATPEFAGCDHYRVDMTATRFGDCVCGQPKAAHSEAATVGGGPAPVGLSTHDKPTDLRHPKSGGGRAARLAAQRKHITDKMESTFGACDAYRVDMTATRFGDCKCGYPKAQHSLTSQRVGNERGSVVQRKTLFQQEPVIPAGLGEGSARASKLRGGVPTGAK